MNNERYNHIIDEAYENYLNNFVEPICPPNVDVQPSYYDPMTKDWFVKSAKERGSRGDEFSEKWGLKIEERELSLEERSKIWNETHNPAGNIYTHSQYNENNLPTKLITITHENEIIEVYE
jgi:hypothetical protein